MNNASRADLQAAYDRGELNWKAAYQLTGKRGQDGLELAREFLTAVDRGHVPTDITGKDDNRIYGDLRLSSGATVEVKTQQITPWTKPVYGELPRGERPLHTFANLYPDQWVQTLPDGKTVPRREFPSSFKELGVWLLDETDHRPWHADWLARTADAFQVSEQQVKDAPIFSKKEGVWYQLGQATQVAVAFTSWLHADLVVYCEPVTRCVVAYTGAQLIAHVREVFTHPSQRNFVRDAGRCSPGTIGLLGVPYGQRRFQQKPDGTWRCMAPTRTAADVGNELRDLLRLNQAAA